MNYKGHTITLEPFGYTVYWEGDEIYFPTIKEAEEFIEENIFKKLLTSRKT